MATKGGYQIVDFGLIDITAGTPETCPGVYNSIAKCNGKPTLLQNVVLGSAALPSFWAAFALSSDDYVAGVVLSDGALYTITVTDEDSVTIEAVSAGE